MYEIVSALCFLINFVSELAAFLFAFFNHLDLVVCIVTFQG